MKKVRYALFAIIVLIGLPLALDMYFFNGQYSSPLALMMNKEAQEYIAIDEAMQLSYENEAVANERLVGLIGNAKDDIVYERAVRQYARNIFDDTPENSLKNIITLATDSRIRPSARSGALEELGEYYTSIYSPYSREELDSALFSNPVLAQVRDSAGEGKSSEQIILEYANQVSVRPLATALLLSVYGKQWYEGSEDAKNDFYKAKELFDVLITEVSPTSPNLPKSYAAAAAGVYYAQAKEVSIAGGLIPDVYLTQALQTAGDVVSTFSSITERPVEDFAGAEFAPLAQLHTVMKVVVVLPQSTFNLNARDAYAAYLAQYPSLDVRAYAPELVELMATAEEESTQALEAEVPVSN